MYSERKQVTYCRFGAQAYAQRKTCVPKSSGLVTRDGVPAAAVGAGITLSSHRPEDGSARAGAAARVRVLAPPLIVVCARRTLPDPSRGCGDLRSNKISAPRSIRLNLPLDGRHALLGGRSLTVGLCRLPRRSSCFELKARRDFVRTCIGFRRATHGQTNHGVYVAHFVIASAGLSRLTSRQPRSAKTGLRPRLTSCSSDRRATGIHQSECAGKSTRRRCRDEEPDLGLRPFVRHG